MTTKDLIGKTITDIKVLMDIELGGLDTAQCYVQLNGQFFVGIPFDETSEDLEITVPSNAKSILKDLSPIPVYHVNKEERSIGEIAERFKRQKASFRYKLSKFLFGKELLMPKEYEPYKVEYRENILVHVKDKKIIDFVWCRNDTDKGMLLLENGYLISETLCAPHGTGAAGLNVICGLDNLASGKDAHYLKLSEQK